MIFGFLGFWFTSGLIVDRSGGVGGLSHSSFIFVSVLDSTRRHYQNPPPPINTPANLILSSSPRLPPRPRHDPPIQLKTLAHQTPSHLYGHSDACEESGQVCYGLQGVVGFATTVEAGSGRGWGGCWEGDGRRGEGVGFVCRWVGGWLVGVWGEDGGESSGFAA